MYCYKTGLLLLVSLSWLQPGLAQEASPDPWLLSLGVQTGDDGSAGYALGLDWGATERTWLSLYGGLSESPNQLADVTTRTLAANLDQRIGPLGFTLGLESWGEPDEVESRDISGSIYLHGEGYRFALKGERREIDITFTITDLAGNQLRRTVDVTAEGLGAAFSVDVSERWRLSADAIRYDYSRELSVLPRLDVFDFLASSALTLANSFIDTEWGIGLEYDASGKAFNLQWRKDRSAVDSSELNSVSVGALLPVAERWDLEFSFGLSDAEDLDRALFGGVYLFFYGGG